MVISQWVNVQMYSRSICTLIMDLLIIEKSYLVPMKKVVFLLLLTGSVAFAQQKDYPIQVVPFNQVHFTDNFWLPRIKTNHTVTIPASFERCESTGRVKNFEMAAAKSGKFCTVYPF